MPSDFAGPSSNAWTQDLLSSAVREDPTHWLSSRVPSGLWSTAERGCTLLWWTTDFKKARRRLPRQQPMRQARWAAPASRSVG